MIGQKINNYEVQSLLGEGGMGSVYAAQHPVLGRRAAIKILRREYALDATLVGRFINEARASSAIRHPGIIEVFDVGTLADGVPYLMMELLEGETLGRRIEREGRLKVVDAVDIAAQAASALAAAHGHGIVHRDLKPENLFLVPDRSQRGGQRVKVLDFGIAKLQRRLSGQSIRTHTGSIMGTPPYMSPEQCRGISGEIDQRTDVYALGIILYEMLTGAPPFLSEGFGDVLLKHLTEAPRRPREIEPSIPPSLEETVLRALEKQPERRLVSMQEFSRELSGPAARTTLREAGDRAVDDPAYAATDVLPRLRPSSSSARRTTLSSTASQLVGNTERLSQVRRRRLAVGALLGSAAIAGALLVRGMGGGGELSGGGAAPATAAPVSVDRAGTTKLSGGTAHPLTAAPGAAPASAPQESPPVAPVEPDVARETEVVPAAAPADLGARKPPPLKPARARSRRADARGPAPVQPAASEFAPLPDVPAGLPAGGGGAAGAGAGTVRSAGGAGEAGAGVQAGASGAPASTGAAGAAPRKPRLSTDKW